MSDEGVKTQAEIDAAEAERLRLSDEMRDPKTGRFLPGSNTTKIRLNKTIKTKIKNARGEFKEALLWVGSLTVGEFDELCKDKDKRYNLTMYKATALQFFSQVLSSKSTGHFEQLAGFLGVKTAVKSVDSEPDDEPTGEGKKLIEVSFVKPEKKVNK